MGEKPTLIDSSGEMAEEASHVSSFAPHSQDKPYEAYKPKPRVHHLKIRRPGQGKISPAYRDLLHVSSDDAGTCFELVFRYLMVRVRGKNLGEVIDAIENHGCDFILEFHASIWKRPETGKPVIEKVEILGKEQDEGKEAA